MSLHLIENLANRKDLKDWGGLGLAIQAYGKRAPIVVKFADKLEKVCVETVEGGSMTKDLALLMPHEQDWHSTEDFLEIIERNLNKKLTVTYQ